MMKIILVSPLHDILSCLVPFPRMWCDASFVEPLLIRFSFFFIGRIFLPQFHFFRQEGSKVFVDVGAVRLYLLTKVKLAFQVAERPIYLHEISIQPFPFKFEDVDGGF